MLEPVFALNKSLGSRLSGLALDDANPLPAMQEVHSRFAITTSPTANTDPETPINVVVTANEVTHLHGTGPLVKRVCLGWPNVFSIRARNDWGGTQDFGDWHTCLTPRPDTRADFFKNVLSVLRNRQVANVLCIPFLQDEFYTSIAIQECFGAKLCAWLMDDQNIAAQNIPDTLMREFLERCSLRLVTHPELREIYQQKYGFPFHVLPAIVPASVVAANATPAPEAFTEGSRGALLGSFWDQRWFDQLCAVLGQCGRPIDWFGNNHSPWFDLSPQKLVQAGITAHGVVPENQLAQKLAEYPFVIVPVGALDGNESNSGVAHLSLPGRILFAIASSNIPVLVVGSNRTCGARFVSHFGVGEVVPYDAITVCAAMNRMCRPEAQQRMRQAAARIAPALSDRGISDWLLRSIERAAPVDSRFDDLFAGYDATIDLHCAASSTRVTW